MGCRAGSQEKVMSLLITRDRSPVLLPSRDFWIRFSVCSGRRSSPSSFQKKPRQQVRLLGSRFVSRINELTFVKIVEKFRHIHLELSAINPLKFLFQPSHNGGRRASLFEHLPNLCPDRVHAEAKPLLDVEQHRSVLVNRLSDALRQLDWTFNFSVLHRSDLHNI